MINEVARKAEEKAYQQLTGSTLGFKGAIRSYLGSEGHKRAMHGSLEMFGLKGKTFAGKSVGTFGRGLGLAFLAYAAYEGFQEGGVTGSAKAVGEGLLSNYMFFRVFGGFSGVGVGLGAAVGGSALLGGLAAASQGMSGLRYVTQSAVGNYMRSRGKLEIASPLNDQYGTISTMRQRGINAMRQSKITARNALGQEANRRLMPYFR